jgi:hypothetical protein
MIKRRFFWILIPIVVVGVLSSAISIRSLPAQDPPTEEAEPAPPANQTYIGARKCAACHFDQYTQWRTTKHAKTFELLPAKYQTDAKCLKCHTTGFGKPGGFKTAADADLKGTGCEQCHGPGSAHAEVAKPFTSAKPNEQQAKAIRDSIWLMLPKNVCVECHSVQGHHPSQTPPELRRAAR